MNMRVHDAMPRDFRDIANEYGQAATRACLNRKMTAAEARRHLEAERRKRETGQK